MASELALDPRSELIWREFVDREYRAPTTPVWGWWPGVIKFCRLGRKQIRQWEQEKGPYRSVYSRAMWPAAHLLAALYKADNPQTRWIAEFSDPLMYDVKGERRESKGELEPAFRTELSAALRTRGLPPPDSDNTYVWIETLVYALADTVLFTNDHQRDYMLGYFPDRRLAGRGAEHAVIEPHPTLPAEFYEVAPSPYSLDPGLVNIAYFGAFYASRGLTEVVEALRALSPATRARVRLHVFTRKPDEIAEEMRGAGLSDVVVPNPFVNYLEFLNLTTRFDALLVNDARTLETHGVNPYLPSKWSDYVGSGRPIWAIVEPGSVLSTRPMAYRSELGDADGARVVLERLVADSIGAVPAP